MRRSWVGVAVGVGVAVAVAVAIDGCSSAQTLGCPVAASACPSLDGVTSFCAWSEWGCAREAPCGGYFAVLDVTVDARLTYFYSAQTGAYVATVREDFSGGNASCPSGPSSFTPPTSCHFWTLASCAPVAQDAGVTPTDAGLGPPDTGSAVPVPSGQPLLQPPK